MKLRILGSGTVCPTLERCSSGYLVEAAGQRIVFDMGVGTMRALLAAGIQANTLDALFLSHIHPDHTADLVAYFFAMNYAPGWQREAPLPIYGPPEVEGFLDRLADAWRWCGPNHWERRFHAMVQGTRVNVGGVQVESFEVVHGDVEPVSYRIEAEGRKLCYSGDSAVCPGLEEAARGVDLFLCECAIPRGYPQKGGHMLSDEVGQLATRAGAARVVITHIYPHGIDLVSQVKDFFSGPVEEATDGRIYEV